MQVESAPKSGKITTTGKILLGVTGGIALGLTAICAPFISPALRKYCLPYVPATCTQIRNVFATLKGRQGKLIDLGSGDGRIVIEGARQGFEAHGVELNWWLVVYSKLQSLKTGVPIRVFRTDLWKFDLSLYGNIVVFGVDQMMGELEKKILTECANRDCYVVACRFPLPNLLPDETFGSGVDRVWLYKLR